MPITLSVDLFSSEALHEAKLLGARAEARMAGAASSQAGPGMPPTQDSERMRC